MLHHMCMCLYLLIFLPWHWLEVESNQWILHSVAALSDLCENNFKSVPMARFRTNHDVNRWLFNSAHHFHWALKILGSVHKCLPYIPCPQSCWHICCLSQLKALKSIPARVTCKTGLMLDPVERLGSLFHLNDSCCCLSREMSVFRHLWHVQGQLN